MNPPVPAVLMQLAAIVGRNAMPGVPEPERASDLGLTAMLLALAAEVWDTAAHRLVEENRSLRVLLDDSGEDQDLRVSVLQKENERLRAKLIEAHVAAEKAGDTRREQAIWAELRASTERRKLSVSIV
ncbi:hypothetical protein [Phenylobacterium soli]|uniref:Uncharacterized protein n=1 Tax=Phenylobacterium soli TaxID=2170551 RepID=A0A328AI82_9CAUL|nr:hypothetical protein [Phenylobacterium soli]RAK53094.1 hypothetical protein DJ017_00375 [Phenylobacterium soli]